LNAAGLELWATTTLTGEDGLPPDLDRDADAVVLMAYDQCWATSNPGPIAADAWIAANLKAKLAGHDPRRFVVALAAYGYDWPRGRKAEVISSAAAEALALHDRATITPDPNPHFDYRASNGAAHEVWYLDGAAFARQRALAEARGVRGVALWRMGLEDPAVWTARAEAPDPPTGPTATCEPLPGR
jgi:spore germination protein YaaH